MQRLSLLRKLAILPVLCSAALVFGQVARDPVDLLRQALRASMRDSAQRAQSVGTAADAVRGLGDLRRAVALPDWRDQDVDPIIANLDRQQRSALEGRFEQAVRAALSQPVPATSIMVCDMLGDLGVTARGVGTQHSLARVFAPDLARLTASADPHLHAAAARALGKIDADPAVAVPALAELLRQESVPVRGVAAVALLDMIRSANDLTFNSRSASGVRILPGELVQVGALVVPAAVAGLSDPEPNLRRLCLEALGWSAQALDRLVLDPPHADETLEAAACRRQLLAEQAELMPLALALRDWGAALAQALGDPDPQNRALGRRLLAIMAEARERWLRRSMMAGLVEDPLLDALRPALPGLIAGLSDADSRARQTAVNILETFGPSAASAAPALARSLTDPDRFVRWAAARTLGKIGGGAAEVVPGLARLLGDPDLDLALAAATALEQLGPAAEAAVPDLARTAIGANEAPLRLAAIQALQAVGPPAAVPACPVLAAALRDPDARVRRAAATALGRFGPAAQDAVELLQAARSDRSPEVQQAAATALLQIMTTEK